MKCAAQDGFIDINVTIPNFQVEAAIRIGANPGFVVNCCPLATKIRQGDKVTRLTLLAFRKVKLFHGVLLPAEILLEYTPIKYRLTRATLT